MWFLGKGFFFKVDGSCPTFWAWNPNGPKKAPPLTGNLKYTKSSVVRSQATSYGGTFFLWKKTRESERMKTKGAPFLTQKAVQFCREQQRSFSSLKHCTYALKALYASEITLTHETLTNYVTTNAFVRILQQTWVHAVLLSVSAVCAWLRVSGWGGGDFGSSMQMGWAIQDKEFGAKPIELIELTGSSLAQVVVKGWVSSPRPQRVNLRTVSSVLLNVWHTSEEGTVTGNYTLDLSLRLPSPSHVYVFYSMFVDAPVRH